MTKYVVTYVWEETCYVEADSPEQAEHLANEIDMVALGLELQEGKVRVRKATREERTSGINFEKAEEGPDLCPRCGAGVSDCATFGCGVEEEGVVDYTPFQIGRCYLCRSPHVYPEDFRR